MHGENGLTNKLCIFFSKILKSHENKIEFFQIKSLLYQLMTCSIDLPEFIEKFPVTLPLQFLEILRSKIQELRNQLSLGIVKIDLLNVPTTHNFSNFSQNNNSMTRKLNLSNSFSTPLKRPFENINENQTSTPKIISVNKTKSIPIVKRKKIDISNQSHSHTELIKLPSIQAFDIGQESKTKSESKPSVEVELKEEIILKTEPIVDNSKCTLNRYNVKDRIMKLMNVEKIENVDFNNVVLFLEKSVEILAEQLLVEAAYYTIHRSNCKSTFIDSNPLYTKIDDYRKVFNDMKNLQILQMSNEEREEKNKLYQAKSEEKKQQQKEDLRNLLNLQNIERSNIVLKTMLNNKKPAVNVEPKKLTFVPKKRITAKDFIIGFRRRLNLQKLPAYKSLLKALNK